MRIRHSAAVTVLSVVLLIPNAALACDHQLLAEFTNRCDAAIDASDHIAERLWCQQAAEQDGVCAADAPSKAEWAASRWHEGYMLILAGLANADTGRHDLGRQQRKHARRILDEIVHDPTAPDRWKKAARKSLADEKRYGY